MPAAIAALALLAIVGAVLVFLEEPSAPANQAVVVLPPPASPTTVVAAEMILVDAPFRRR